MATAGWNGAPLNQAGYDNLRKTRDDLKQAHAEIERELGSFISSVKIGVNYTDRSKKLSVQEAYLRAFRAFGEFRGGSSKAWILTIVRNCHLNWRADQRRRANIEPLESMSHADDPAFEDADISERADLPREEITPETILAQRMEADEVRLVLAGLPEAFREALVLRELECLSYREISDVTSIPIGTVMSRLARARAIFATAWRQRLAA